MHSHIWKIASSVAKKNIGMTMLAAAVVAGSVVTALIPPLVLERIVDALTAHQGIQLSMAGLYLLVFAVSGILESLQNGMITMMGQKITHEMRSVMSRKLEQLPTQYYTTHETGKITSRFVADVDAVDSLFTNGIISMFADAFKVISIMIVIFVKSKGLGILMCIVTPILFQMTLVFQRRMRKAQMENRQAVAKVNHHVPETIQNIRMIHIFSAEGFMERKYDSYIEEGYQAMDKSNFYDAIYSPIILFISSIVIAGMMIGASLGSGVQQFFGITIGSAVAIIAYVGKVFDPLESIGMEIQNIQSALAGVKRIDEFLDEEQRSERNEDAKELEIKCSNRNEQEQKLELQGDNRKMPILKTDNKKQYLQENESVDESDGKCKYRDIIERNKVNNEDASENKKEIDTNSNGRKNKDIYQNKFENLEETDTYEKNNAEDTVEIRFDKVHFGYESDREILTDIDLEIHSGENVIITGRTGAGKSTLFKLLLGLYAPHKGRVMINDMDAAEIPEEQKRKLFGYVEQQFSIVEGSIAEQIRLFDTVVTDEAIWQVLEHCGLAQKIRQLPENIHRKMNKADFSQGELQLLSIARALAANPKIMLLDEMTANLDSVTEHRILDVLHDASQGRTVISISHRMSEQMENTRVIHIS